MPDETSPVVLARELLSYSRKIATKIRDETTTATRRLRVCEKLLLDKPVDESLELLRLRLAELDIDQRHYWVGTFYTLLLSSAERQAQAAYFTPPHLSRNIIALLQNYGFDQDIHSVIDPAAGGAAFLSTIAGEIRSGRRATQRDLRRLRGMELDSGLARLSETLISKRLGIDVPSGSVVTHRDSLSMRVSQLYDVVIANPPYGRLFLSDVETERWSKVCHKGHINKYALFAELSFRLVKPGGLIALILPSSFIGGPLYDRLRKFIRTSGEVLMLGSVVDRQDVFLDVDQDVSVLLARAGKAHEAKSTVSFGAFRGREPFRALTAAKLPTDTAAAWCAPPKASGLAVGGATLADYGATVRSGYFVWNREQTRMRKSSRGALVFPLIWAKNVKPGKWCIPAAKRGKGVDYVKFERDGPGIQRSEAIVLQRTTNNAQPRRLVAARVPPRVIRDHGGFVTENHTIVVTAADAKTLATLTALLNSKAVDDRYRQKSGTASISVTLLRELDLPVPTDLAAALAKASDFELAVVEAYALSENAAHVEAA